MRLKIFCTFLLPAFSLLPACNPDRIYEKHEEPSAVLEWASDDTISFSVDIADTTVPYDFIFALRYAQGFPVEKLKVEMNHITPDGRQRYRMHEIVVAKNGEYLGKGLGDIWDLDQVIAEDERLDSRGLHTFRFTPAGPVDPVPLVMEVGFAVDKSGE